MLIELHYSVKEPENITMLYPNSTDMAFSTINAVRVRNDPFFSVCSSQWVEIIF